MTTDNRVHMLIYEVLLATGSSVDLKLIMVVPKVTFKEKSSRD